jgi:hypothetical protein
MLQGQAPAPGQSTVSNANNSIGAMTGFYSDANFRTHGFLRTPDWHHLKYGEEWFMTHDYYDVVEGVQPMGCESGNIVFRLT